MERKAHKILLGLCDYTTISENEAERVVDQLTQHEWWPEDNFIRKPELLRHVRAHTLHEHVDIPIVETEILKQIKETDGDINLSEYSWRSDSAKLSRPLQEAMIKTTNWKKWLDSLDNDLATKVVQEHDAELVKNYKDEGGSYYGDLTGLVKRCAPGSELAVMLFERVRKETSRSAKDYFEDACIKIPKSLVDKDWLEFSDLIRGFMVNREDMSPDKRDVALRCMLRVRPGLVLNSKLDWDHVRRLPSKLYAQIPDFVKHNLSNLVGKPIELLEFTKLVFRLTIKNPPLGKDLIIKYERLNIGDPETQMQENQLAKISSLSSDKEYDVYQTWIKKCGTKTSQDMALDFLDCSSFGDMKKEEKKAVYVRIMAEPVSLFEVIDNHVVVKKDD